MVPFRKYADSLKGPVSTSVAKGWHGVQTASAIFRRFFGGKRSPIWKVRLFRSSWWFLTIMACTLGASYGIVRGSHWMWKGLLSAEPRLFNESQWMRKLIISTTVPQLVFSLILVGVWFWGRRRSRHWGMTFVPTQFLARLDAVTAAHNEELEFVPKMRELMRCQHGRRGRSDLDFLLRTVTDDERRRRNLLYCLDRSCLATAKRYLDYRLGLSAFWAMLLWMVYFFYAQLILPFLVFPAGSWVPTFWAFIGDSKELKTLLTLVTLAGAVIPVLRYLAHARASQ